MIPEEIRLHWQRPAALPDLERDDVHIWAVDLTRPSPSLQLVRQLLAADELERANKFHFDEDREFYIYARGVLRLLIGRYQKLPPEDVTLVYGEQGKPALAEDSSLTFNVSHAFGVALIGFARKRDIGVDIEMIRPLSDARAVARRSFSATEFEEWTAVAEPQKMQAFFNCWTRKEAYIKATGQGLACPLGSFAVTLVPEETAALLHINGSQVQAAQWHLEAVVPAQNYVGAVLVAGSDWTLSQFAWPL